MALFRLFICLIFTCCIDFTTARYAVLTSSYNSNTILALSQSPYVVKNNVNIGDGVVFEIENGVEILFVSDEYYYIACVNCILNIGCDSMSNGVDSTSTNRRGLASNTTYTYIHLNNSESFDKWHLRGSIRVWENTQAKFCNVKFKGLDAVIAVADSAPNIPLVFDNCEFYATYYVTEGKCCSIPELFMIFNDPWFHDVSHIQNHYSSCDFHNCIVS